MNANDGKDYRRYTYFIYQVPKFNYFLTLQKGKSVDSHTSPPLSWNPASNTMNARNRLLIMSTLQGVPKVRSSNFMRYNI